MADPDLAARLRAVATWAGLAGPLVGFGAVLLAALLSPTFSWSANALSDLGGADAATPWLFNGGLVAAGLVGLPFAGVLVATARHVLESFGAVAYGASVVALALVGAFPTGTDLHIPAAVGYFALFTLAMWLQGSGAVLAGDARRGLAAVWLGIGHLLQWVAWAAGLRLGEGLAIPELIGSLLLLAWLAWTTRWLRGRPRRADPVDST